MADDVLAEALARIEHKVDALLRHFKVQATPMSFDGQTCPACNSVIKYDVDVLKGVVVRRCLCSTGKFVTKLTFHVSPVQPPGTSNDNSTAVDDLESAIKSISAIGKGR